MPGPPTAPRWRTTAQAQARPELEASKSTARRGAVTRMSASTPLAQPKKTPRHQGAGMSVLTLTMRVCPSAADNPAP
jgi:hypothetical protein